METDPCRGSWLVWCHSHTVCMHGCALMLNAYTIYIHKEFSDNTYKWMAAKQTSKGSVQQEFCPQRQGHLEKHRTGNHHEKASQRHALGKILCTALANQLPLLLVALSESPLNLQPLHLISSPCSSLSHVCQFHPPLLLF